MATLAVIGAGNMGGAIVRGAIDKAVLAPAEITIIDQDPAVQSRFAAIGCGVSSNLADAHDHQQVLLATKPQQFPAVAQAMGPMLRPQVVISVMAGLSSHSIRGKLGDLARVVRVMPNTPCQLGEGMSGLAPGGGALPGDETLARALFSAIGDVVEVDESMMHAVTAVSGSGPAYVFLLAESMQQAAEQMGLSPGAARSMATQTLYGASKLLRESDLRASELRQAVTSPGGTTAAALEVMFERELPEIIIEAIQAARDRGIELDQPPLS